MKIPGLRRENKFSNQRKKVDGIPVSHFTHSSIITNQQGEMKDA